MLVAVELIWLRACLPSLALPQWPRRAAAAAKLFEVLRGNGNGAERRGRYLSEGAGGAIGAGACAGCRGGGWRGGTCIATCRRDYCQNDARPSVR